jgi:phosphopantothenoylcysteine decarboxylase / phosphopantothenate---cysteine ligase
VRILITAGPTREYWDSVRFLSSASTGLMGIEMAKAAVAAGHEAVLVLGPTHLAPPADPKIEVYNVETALEMLRACREEWETCDALVATAAVADYRPANPVKGKPEKSDGPVTLELARNPDILAQLAATKGTRPVVGFALQVEEAEARAKRKLVRKKIDAVVLDSPAAFGATHGDFVLIRANGSMRVLAGVSKADVAREILALIAELRA